MVSHLLEILSRNKAFFILFAIFVIIGVYWVSVMQHGELVLMMDVRHTPLFDTFFSLITHLGSGWFYVIVILGLLFYRALYAIIALGCFLISSGVAQGLKNFVFADRIRPKLWFEGYSWKLNFVEGVDIHSYMSFPSGHTTTIFSLAILLLMIFKNAKWGVIYFGVALVVALSRVYLAQHFFVDIIAGAMIGVAVTMITYSVMRLNLSTRRNPWLDWSFLNPSSRVT